MKKRSLLILGFLSFVVLAKAQYTNSTFLDSLLQTKPILKKVKDGAKKYRLQIIYSPITREKDGSMTFKNHYFNVSPQNYFYCASLIKLPTSIIALEKINELKTKGITKKTIMYTDSCMPCMNKVKKDTSANNQQPSIEQYIKEMLLVSDNAAYSRVYEFCGTDLLNKRLKEWNTKHTYIINRYDGRCYQENNFNTNPIAFIDAKGKTMYEQACIKGKTIVSDNICVKSIGKAYYNSKNKLIKQPKNFEGMNESSLPDMHLILQKLISQSSDYKINNEDWQFLMKYAALYPREGENTHYFGKTYFDSYKKYLIYGDSKKNIVNQNIRIFNIVGQSYGFMSDCAYIVDFENNIEFMLSAALYANEDEVINDGRYDYNTIALPFLAELGKSILKYEQTKLKPQNILFLKDLKAVFEK
jgi:hypothetical protein